MSELSAAVSLPTANDAALSPEHLLAQFWQTCPNGTPPSIRPRNEDAIEVGYANDPDRLEATRSGAC
jgi:hypothetical protein